MLKLTLPSSHHHLPGRHLRVGTTEEISALIRRNTIAWGVNALLWIANLLVWVFLFMEHTVFAYPQTSVLGYNSCSSCHASPAGGGALTNYGRGVLADRMASWGSPQEAFATLMPESILLGGDVRYLSLSTPYGTNHFLMQSDLEAAIKLTPHVTIASSIGNYAEGIDGSLSDLQIRRNYLLIAPNDNFGLRCGKFLPAFGLMVPDHTVPTRDSLGLGQGSETYNVELGLRNQLGEIFLTYSWGPEVWLRMTDKRGYYPKGTSPGLTARATGFFGKRSLAGVSYLNNGDLSAVGPYGIVGLTDRIYGMAEWYLASYGDIREDLAYGLVGWEFFQGLHAQSIYENAEGHALGLQLQWLPRPHFEFLLKAIPGATYQALFHFHI